MPFRSNDTLITTAMEMDVVANNAADVYDGGGGATAFVIADGNVGDDTLENFDNDDSIINSRAIFDGNGDGFIQFGPNGVLDVDRTGRGPANAGPDQIQVVGSNDDAVLELRYLGSKGGQHVYADSSTLRNLDAVFGEDNVVEGDVSDDTIDASGDGTVILHDNALGLNLGGDMIEGFGDDDLLVTTELLFDSNGDDVIDFAENDVLDTSAGDQGPEPTDPDEGPGGQLMFNGEELTSLDYLGSADIDGVTYYFYGTDGSTFDPGSLAA